MTGAAGAQATLKSASPPGYPLAAKAAGIDGSVKLTGTVSKDGRMQNLKVLSGPPELRQAAYDAVMRWVYKPYRHFGRLVEVETSVTVNFDMGKGEAKAREQEKARAELLRGTRTEVPDTTANSPETSEPKD